MLINPPIVQHDYQTPEGAEKLVRVIARYWELRGFHPDVWAQDVGRGNLGSSL